MHGFQMHGDPVRLEDLHERIRKLLTDALLHREAAREQPDEARQLRQPEDVLMGDVAHIRQRVHKRFGRPLMDHQPHMSDPIDALIAALDDPTRRALYRYVAGSDHEVSRDEAAGAAGVSRSAAAFHLDKLVDAGLLIPSFRRLNDRSGPGAGRPAKLYRSSRSAIELSIPPRRYLIAGEILTSALRAISPVTAEAAVRRAAVERGRRVVEELRQDGLAGPPLTSALRLLGFEPHVAPGR
jgi:DNA-binding transcriptional ArsR family regulator